MTSMNAVDFDLAAAVSAVTDAGSADAALPMPTESVSAFETAMGRPSAEAEPLPSVFGAAVKAVAEGLDVAVPEAQSPVSADVPCASAPKAVATADAPCAPAPKAVATADAPCVPAPKVVATADTLKTVVEETLSIKLPKPLVLADRSRPKAEADPTDEQPAVVAAPVVVPQSADIAARPADSATPFARTDAVESVVRIERIVPAAETLVQAAEAVADALYVSPGLMSGEGEIVIRLRPDVLDGSEVMINVSGKQLGVEFRPVLADTAAFIERNLPQLQQVLAQRVHARVVGVTVKKVRDGRV